MVVYFLGWKAQYEKLFIGHLAEHYSVVYLDQSRFWNRLNRFSRRFLGRRWVARLATLYARRAGFCADDLLICNEGEIHRKFNAPIVRAFPGKKVLLVRDLIGPDFLEKWAGLFDAIYSFDRQQCDDLGIRYLHQFFPMGFSYTKSASAAISQERVATKALFIGRDKGRSNALVHLAELLVECGCEVDFRILVDACFMDKTRYHITHLVDYQECVSATMSAGVIVEINQVGQAGVTLRALEAAYFGKKLITNNSSMREHSFYNDRNVYVFDDPQTVDVDELRRFLALRTEPVSSEVLYEYSPEHMLETLMQQHGCSV